MPRQNNFMVAPASVGHRHGRTSSSHHGGWSDVQGRGVARGGFVPHLQNTLELSAPDGNKNLCSFVDKAFPYNKERKMAVQGPRTRSFSQRCKKPHTSGVHRPSYHMKFHPKFDDYCEREDELDVMINKIEDKFNQELQAQQDIFDSKLEQFHDNLKMKIKMLEERVHHLENNVQESPSKKQRSESMSTLSPVRYHPLPMDKKLEAKLHGITSISTCLENHIDSQILFLDKNIEQLRSIHFQLRRFQQSQSHMSSMFGELNRTVRLHDEDKMFQILGEVKSSKVVHLYDNISEGFQTQAEFLGKLSRHIIELEPAWGVIRSAIVNMNNELKQYKIWLQEHSDLSESEEFPLHFLQAFNKFHDMWDSQEANIVRDSLPATALDAVFNMISKHVKLLQELQSAHKLPSDYVKHQDFLQPIELFNKKMNKFNSIAHPVKHRCFMTTLREKPSNQPVLQDQVSKNDLEKDTVAESTQASLQRQLPSDTPTPPDHIRNAQSLHVTASSVQGPTLPTVSVASPSTPSTQSPSNINVKLQHPGQPSVNLSSDNDSDDSDSDSAISIEIPTNLKQDYVLPNKPRVKQEEDEEDQLPGSSAATRTHSQGNPEVSTMSATASNTNSNAVSHSHMPLSPVIQGVNPVHSTRASTMTYSESLPPRSELHSNIDESPTQSDLHRTTSNFSNLNRSNVNSNTSHATPSDIRTRSTGHDERININTVCMQNLELFAALAKKDPTAARKLHLSQSKNSTYYPNTPNTQEYHQQDDNPSTPVLSWESLQQNQSQILLANPPDPSEPSDDSDSSESTQSTKSSSTKRKRGSKKKKKKKQVPPTPVSRSVPNTILMTKDEIEEALEEVMDFEDWDNNAYFIMQLYRKDKRKLLIALSAHRIKLEKEKQSRVQTKLLDFAKKQNLSTLQYDDNAEKCRVHYSRWIKTVKSVITCFHTYQAIFDEKMRIHSLPTSMSEENKALYIFVNSYVHGHWKNILARKEIQNKGDKALKQIRKTCMTLTESQKNHYHIKLTTLRMSRDESVTAFLRRFTSAHKWAEEAGFEYKNDFLVDLALGQIEKSDNQEYKIHALNYKNQREQKNSIPFASLEQKFQNLDLDLDNHGKRPTRHQANMSTHTSYDTPSNKINRGPSHKRDSKKFNNKKTNKPGTDSKKHKGTRKCYVCGDPNHIAPHCPHEEKKAAWIAKRREKATRARAAPAQAREEPEDHTEYVSAARIVFPEQNDPITLNNNPYGHDHLTITVQ